jgi:hypothetical protein
MPGREVTKLRSTRQTYALEIYPENPLLAKPATNRYLLSFWSIQPSRPNTKPLEAYYNGELKAFK